MPLTMPKEFITLEYFKKITTDRLKDEMYDDYVKNGKLQVSFSSYDFSIVRACTTNYYSESYISDGYKYHSLIKCNNKFNQPIYKKERKIRQDDFNISRNMPDWDDIYIDGDIVIVNNAVKLTD